MTDHAPFSNVLLSVGYDMTCYRQPVQFFTPPTVSDTAYKLKIGQFGHQQYYRSVDRMQYFIYFHNNYASVSYCLQKIWRVILSKDVNLIIPEVHLALYWKLAPTQFCTSLVQQETGVPALLFSIACVIQSLAILTQCQHCH